MATQNTQASDVIAHLFEAGAHFGYTKSRRHPSVKSLIFGVKNKVELIDLEKTAEYLEKAEACAFELGKTGKKLLFVSGKAEARKGIISAADATDMPYVVGRWIGGTLTNFGEIRKRVEKLVEMREKRDKGEFDKHTKKERLMFSREIERLENMYEGLVRMEEKPDAVFIVDTTTEHIAVAEARHLGLPVISISGTDCDLSVSDYPVPANDKSGATVEFIAGRISDAYKKGVAEKPAPKKPESTQTASGDTKDA